MKAFSFIFQNGSTIIEHTYRKADLENEYAIRDFAVQRKWGRRKLRQLQSGAWRGNLCNLTMTTLEGVGLGLLGIGMPDIVLFLGTLLKGIYKTALRYGFQYDSPQEQMFILKMMATALFTGDDWVERNMQVEKFMGGDTLSLVSALLPISICSWEKPHRYLPWIFFF